MARRKMARHVILTINQAAHPTHPSEINLIALEDYAQNPHQQVSYQIAEVGGMVKDHCVSSNLPLMLVNPSKVKAMVSDHRISGKQPIIDWAESNGFPLPGKKPGQPGLYKRQREDLADAFVLWTMSHVAYDLICGRPIEWLTQRQRDIFEKPGTGLLTKPGLILNKECM